MKGLREMSPSDRAKYLGFIDAHNKLNFEIFESSIKDFFDNNIERSKLRMTC